MSPLRASAALIAAVTLFVTACAERHTSSDPLALLARGPSSSRTVRGAVVERVDAGPYQYLRVRTERGDEWLATLRMAAPRATAATVTARVLAEAPRFYSRRLDRTFASLAFVSIHNDP